MAFVRSTLLLAPKLGFGARAICGMSRLAVLSLTSSHAEPNPHLSQMMRFAHSTKHMRVAHLPDELALRHSVRSFAAQRGPLTGGVRRAGVVCGFPNLRVGASPCPARRVLQGTSGVALRRCDAIWSLWPDTTSRSVNNAQQNADRRLPARGNKGCGAARKQGRRI